MKALTQQDRIKLFAELSLWLHLSWTEFKDMGEDIALMLRREVRVLLGKPPEDPTP